MTLAYAGIELWKVSLMQQLLYLGLICVALWAAPAKAQQLQLLVGMEKPPYIKVESQTGYELDLLKAVVKRMGFDSQFIHVPNGRLLTLFSDGQADLVCMARPFLADADFVNKAAADQADLINTCIACNQACLDHVFQNKRASCLVNPRAC